MKLRGLPLSALIFSILIIVVITVNIKPNVKSNHGEILNKEEVFIDSLSNDIISEAEILRSLKRTYYENDLYAGFNSASLTIEKPDLHNMRWILELMILLKFDESFFDKIKTELVPFIIPEKLSLANIRNLVSIGDILDTEIIQKDEIIKLLLKNYIESEHLFFFSDKNDEEEIKIIATSIAVEIINKAELQFPYIEEINENMRSLYKENRFFTNEDINYNILNNGGLIISTLVNMGINEENIDMTLKERDLRLGWYNNWAEEVKKINNHDWMSVSILTEFINISKFFSKDFDVNNSYIDDLFSNSSSLKRMNGTEKNFVIEPFYIYNVLTLSNHQQMPFPFSLELRDYVADMINSDFTKYANPTINPYDNYYGIKLSNKYKFQINKDKMGVLLKERYNELIKDSKIKSIKELYELYYLVYCSYELDFLIGDKKKLSQIVNEHLISINYSESSQVNDYILTTKVGIEILQLLGERFSINNIQLFLGDLDTGKYDKLLKSDTEFTLNLYYILKNLGLLNEYEEVTEKIYSHLSNEFHNNSFLSKKESAYIVDVISISKILEVLDDIKKLSSQDKYNIKKYIHSLKVDRNVINNSPSNKTRNLQVLYEADKLLKLIN